MHAYAAAQLVCPAEYGRFGGCAGRCRRVGCCTRSRSRGRTSAAQPVDKYLACRLFLGLTQAHTMAEALHVAKILHTNAWYDIGRNYV